MHGLPFFPCALTSCGALGAQALARALAWHGAINTSTPATFTRALRQHYYGAVSFIDEQIGP